MKISGGSRSSIARAGMDSVKITPLGSVTNASVGKPYSRPAIDYREQPRLAVELYSNERHFSKLELMGSELKKSYLAAKFMLNLIEKGDHESLDYKRARRELLERLVSDTSGLDSTLNIKDKNLSIEFTLQGFNIFREQENDELVSLFIDGALMQIQFEHDVMPQEFIARLTSLFSKNSLSLRVERNGDFVIGMQESRWIAWDKKINVSGEGHRYPSGSIIQLQAQALKPVIQTLRDPRVTIEETKSFLSHVIESIALVLAEIEQLSSKAKENIKSLVGSYKCDVHTSLSSSIKTMSESPVRSLFTLTDKVKGPNRFNVEKLLV